MRHQYLFILLILALTSCSKSREVNEYSYEISESLIFKANNGHLTQNDYYDIISQLDGMFEVVYTKAQQANDIGIAKDSLRNHLAKDQEYLIISKQAMVLDSIINNYIKTPISPYEMRAKYYQITSQAAKRAVRVGLF